MKYPINPTTQKKLLERLARLGVIEEDLEEKFIKGSGPGGQKINKTSSCVYLLHKLTGIEIKCQRGRSQIMNRYYARCELCERLEGKILGEQSKRQQEIEKIRRQKKRRTRRQKEQMLKNKRERGEIKAGRKKPGSED